MLNLILKILFHCYNFIFLTFSLLRLWMLLDPSGQADMYYRILYGFDHTLIFLFILALIQAILSIMHFFPMLFLLFNIEILNPKFWKYMLALRLIFDIAGHSFETNYLASFYHSDPKIALIILIQYLSFYIPSYIACYIYASKKRDAQYQLFKV